jgi:hypothetical protein
MQQTAFAGSSSSIQGSGSSSSNLCKSQAESSRQATKQQTAFAGSSTSGSNLQESEAVDKVAGNCHKLQLSTCNSCICVGM